jgi:choline dehydrogenase
MWDYIIVGGGSAGCVVASRLSESRSNRVLLLNAGAGFLDKTPIVTAPGGAMYQYDNRHFDWSYAVDRDHSLNNRPSVMHAGKVLGGGSAINGAMFIRGGAHDFDEWAQLGNPGWDYESVLPFLKKMEHTSIGLDEFHGRNGPIGVEYAAPMLDISHRFLEAAIEAGFAYNADINGKSLEGFTRTPCSIFKGVRQSTALAYLYPARRRRNLKVISGAVVHKILFDGNRACGVEYSKGGKRQVVHADREIVVSAGAVRSPQLLMLSGIGDERELRAMGIEPRVHSPGVGSNYMDHAAAHMMFEIGIKSWSSEVSLFKQFSNGVRWLFTREGPAASGVCQVTGFIKSSPDEAQPDLQICLLPISLYPSEDDATTGFGKPPKGKSRDMVMVYVDACKPRARGRLELVSDRPSDMPRIIPNLLGDNTSLQKTLKGVSIIRQIMEGDAIRPIVVREVRPGPAKSGDGLETWLKSTAMSMAHPSGTCKMGSDPEAVVDHQLRVLGVSGLRVIDASIMPSIPSGNINAPTILIAEKGAHMLECERRPSI